MFSCIHSTCTNAITASDHTGTQYTRCVGGGGEDDGDGGDRWGDGTTAPTEGTFTVRFGIMYLL